ncbi:MAG: hypothetical protein AAFY98_07555 [Verrucomicrobiota bacterium]
MKNRPSAGKNGKNAKSGESRPKASSKMMRPKQKLKGISRIDQPDKHNHGWFVRVTRNRRTFSEFFADKKHGGKAKSLVAAKEGYEKLRAKHPPMSRKDFAQIQRRRNSSGIVGVTRLTKVVRGKEYHFWQATWSPVRGEIHKKAYSISKYGEEKARLIAIRNRKKGLKTMTD